jgi:small Trp-rich protein
MPLIVIGMLLIALRLMGWAPLVEVGWWWFLVPFGLAAVWWAVADATGITQRRAMQKMEDRKVQRRQRAMAQLGLNTPHHTQQDPSRQNSARRSGAGSDSNRAAASREPRR